MFDHLPDRPAPSNVAPVRASQAPEDASLAYLRRASARLRRRYSGDKQYAEKLIAILARVKRPDDVGAAIEAHRRFRRFAMRQLRDDGDVEAWLPGLLDTLISIIESDGFISYTHGCWWKRHPLSPEGIG